MKIDVYRFFQSAHVIPAGIIEMRHGMWEKVASRSHKPSMIYPFGKSGDDVMLHGTVDYELKDGKKAEGIEWAARAKFGAENGGLKMVFYQVYLVSLMYSFENHVLEDKG
jgi:hypothetical protein